MNKKTWRQVADILAQRMVYTVFCDNGHATIEEGLAAGCPNCDDSEAMRIYWANGGKIGTGVPALLDGAKLVPIHEILEATHADSLSGAADEGTK